MVCLQCSLQVWASDSSSTSVGILPDFRKYSRIARSWERSSASGPLRIPVSGSGIPSFPSLERSLSSSSRSTLPAVGSSWRETKGVTGSMPSSPYSSLLFTWTLWISGFASVIASLSSNDAGSFPKTKKSREEKTASPSPNRNERKSSIVCCAVVPTLSVTPGRNPTSIA